MRSKFRNRIRQILYRPTRKSPHRTYMAEKLADAEQTLDTLVGGPQRRKRRSRAQEKKESEEE